MKSTQDVLKTVNDCLMGKDKIDTIDDAICFLKGIKLDECFQCDKDIVVERNGEKEFLVWRISDNVYIGKYYVEKDGYIELGRYVYERKQYLNDAIDGIKEYIGEYDQDQLSLIEKNLKKRISESNSRGELAINESLYGILKKLKRNL